MPAAGGINAAPKANIDETTERAERSNYDHALNEIVRLLGIVWSEVERIEFERSHQLSDELIALIYVRFDSVCVIAERVALAASAVVAMHVTGRILPCISLPEGY